MEGLKEWFYFIQQPRSELGNLPICPYAKLATEDKHIVLDVSLARIEEALDCVDLQKNLVTILILKDYWRYDVKYLQDLTKQLNQKYGSRDLVILENDPRSPMVINEVTTTFQKHFLWLIQSLSDLNKKSSDLQKTSYYDYWTQEQLNEVVTWRT